MFELGLSTNGSGPILPRIEDCGRAGIPYMELLMHRDEWPDFDLAGAHKLAADAGVTIRSYHLPFWPDRNLAASDRAVREETIEAHAALIARGVRHGVLIYTVHPGAEPIEDAERRERIECAKDSLVRLADAAEREGAVLAVEDLPRSCPGHNTEEMLEILGCDDRLRSTLDTNHILYEPLYDYIAAVADRLVNTHISDYDLTHERHVMPGEGMIDWQRVTGILKDAGYTGPWLYELNFKSAVEVAGREYCADDLVHVSKEIFDGIKPSVLRDGIWTREKGMFSE